MEKPDNQGERVTMFHNKDNLDYCFLHIRSRGFGSMECHLVNSGFLHPFRKTLLIQQSEYSPEFVYPMMNFILNLVFQSLIVLMGNKFSYRILILVGMIISTIALCILPIVVYFISGLTGFLLTSFIILFQGFANAIVLSGFYGIASFLPVKYVIAFSTGQGLAGILMNVIRYIVILSFGDSEDDVTITKGAIVFFAIAALIVLINIYFLNVKNK